MNNIKIKSFVIENFIMNTFTQIQNSIINFEMKYNNIKVKIMKIFKIYIEIIKFIHLVTIHKPNNPIATYALSEAHRFCELTLAVKLFL